MHRFCFHVFYYVWRNLFLYHFHDAFDLSRISNDIADCSRSRDAFFEKQICFHRRISNDVVYSVLYIERFKSEQINIEI